MGTTRIFDQKHYDELNRARMGATRPVVEAIKKKPGIATAVDVGCGVGEFCSFLKELELSVVGVEGRPENAEEARRRNPGVAFHVADAEDEKVRELGKFDLVFCFGLLYHLENPFKAIRNLFALTNKVLLAEGLCYPSDEPILGLIDETKYEDQGLTFVAFYPSEACLTKMFYLSGFRHVYRFRRLPAHPHYIADRNGHKARTVLAASLCPLPDDLLVPLAEPASSIRPWESLRRPSEHLQTLGRFFQRPWSEQVAAVKRITGIK